ALGDRSWERPAGRAQGTVHAVLPVGFRGHRLLLHCLTRFQEETSSSRNATGWERRVRNRDAARTLLVTRPTGVGRRDAGAVLAWRAGRAPGRRGFGLA